MTSGKSFSEQLESVSPRIRGGRPYLRKVFELTAPIVGENGPDAVSAARKTVLHWMERRSGRLPDAAWKFEGFELDQAVAPSSVVAYRDEHDIWAARLDDADKSMAGRSWTTEVMVALAQDGQALFGARLFVSTRGGDLPYHSSTPGCVKQIIDAPGLTDGGRRLSGSAWAIASEADASDFIRLIESRDRALPVVAISLREPNDNEKDAIVDVSQLAKGCVGVAHIVVVPQEFTYFLTNTIGKQFSVFDGAVRTYRPDFDRYEDRPYAHPLALRRTIENWGQRGAVEFEEMLVESSYRSSISKPSSEQVFPRYSTVRSFVTRQRRREAESQNDLAEQLELANIEISELRNDKSEWEELAIAESDDRKQAERHVDDLRQELHRLRNRISGLENRIESVSNEAVDTRIQLPESLNELQEWADENLAGRLTVTGRASRSSKNAEFGDVELAYRAVLLLANEYRQMKLIGGPSLVSAFNSRSKELGLECCQTFSGPGAGEQGDEYYITWNQKKQPLDMHLKNRGNTRDPSRCLRIYFFWDDLGQQVVIGSMPAHLRSRLT